MFPRAGLPPNSAGLQVRRARKPNKSRRPAACVAIQASLKGQKIYVPGFVPAKHRRQTRQSRGSFALEILSTPSGSLFSRLRARLKFSLSSGARRRRRTPLTDELQRSAPSVRARSLLSLSRYLRRLFNPFFHPSSGSAESRDDPGLMAARRSEVATEPRLVVLSDVGLGLCGKTGGRG